MTTPQPPAPTPSPSSEIARPCPEAIEMREITPTWPCLIWHPHTKKWERPSNLTIAINSANWGYTYWKTPVDFPVRIATLEADLAREKQAYLALASDKNDMEQEVADLKAIRRTGKSEADYQFRERQLRAHADALAEALKGAEANLADLLELGNGNSMWVLKKMTIISNGRNSREEVNDALAAYAATKEGKS